MDRELLLKALIDWNFWYREQYTGIPRDYAKKVLEIMNSWLVADVVGVKRSGKSTIFNQAIKELISSGVDPLDTLIINFEDPRFSEITDANSLFKLYEIYQEIRKQKDKKPFIFLDEVQKVKNWENFVRSLIDRKEAHIAVSGSTSSVTRGKLRESLAGRHSSIIVYPLSFREFLQFKGIKILSELDIIANETKIKSYFLDYLKYGGFPLVAINDTIKENIILNLYEDIVSKDIIEYCKIRNENQLRSLSLYYITNIGNRISFRRISRVLGIPLRNVERYTDCIMNSYLISLVNPLSPNLTQMLRAEKKVYVIDQGISNVIGYKLNETLGPLLENAVYIELARRYGTQNLFYYRGKNEVDFVILRNNSVQEIYQVTYSLSNLERETKGLREILEKKKDVQAYILTFDEEKEIKILDKKVPILKSWKWMLSK
ncbi:AAA family ATPase [Acidianus sulfidivorans JP7]|uniref:ATP-binding protein n=1 Tax=Acidianus sulfidivorans TaxID=312539 RepID=UPI0014434C06|nr:ATP-binding protein [Acidianus sulfidivorans]AWR97892.2 AAA family ATPase [Acidianus sulfidivorans JP7]